MQITVPRSPEHVQARLDRPCSDVALAHRLKRRALTVILGEG